MRTADRESPPSSKKSSSGSTATPTTSLQVSFRTAAPSEHLAGGTFTLNNHGGLEVDGATAAGFLRHGIDGLTATGEGP
ncbi:hypothetical protein [Streptomyces venetus]|uniref:hypothetical protein n=1 Tax=Streptomyces venetus TaxID=1701086 RepID=UPI003C2B46E8